MDAVEPYRPAEDAFEELKVELGAQAVLTGNDIPLRNSSDWSSKPACRPVAVLRPTDAAETARAVAACRAARLPFVPQGGLTGLCGGATPEPGGSRISLERMVGIEEIDPASATMTVQGRHAARASCSRPLTTRLPLPARSRRARLLRHRRQRLDQCRRQPRHPLRHDARHGARPRGGAGRRHGASRASTS